MKTIEQIKEELNSLTKVSAGKMSKSDNYEVVEYVQLDQVIEIVERNITDTISISAEE